MPGILVLTSLFIARYLARSKQPPPRQVVAETPQVVNTQRINKVRATIPVHLNGVITASEKITLVSETNGQYTDIMPQFQEGMRVSKGQVIGKINPVEYETLLKKWEFQLAGARLELELLEEKSKTQSQDWVQLQKVTTLNTEPNAWVKQEPQKEVLKKQIEYLAQEVELARYNLARTEITAPFDGFILKKFMYTGAYCNRGSPVIECVPEDGLEAEFLVGQAILNLTETIESVVVQYDRLEYETTRLVYRGEVDPGSKLNVLNARLVTKDKPFIPLKSIVTATLSVLPKEEYFEIPVESLHLNREVWTVKNGQKLAIEEISLLYLGQDKAYVSMPQSMPIELITSSLKEPYAGMNIAVRNQNQ